MSDAKKVEQQVNNVTVNSDEWYRQFKIATKIIL